MIELAPNAAFSAALADPGTRIQADRRFRAWLASTGAILGESQYTYETDGRILVDTATDLRNAWAAFSPAALAPEELEASNDRQQFEAVKAAILDNTATAAHVRQAVRWLVKRELARGNA